MEYTYINPEYLQTVSGGDMSIIEEIVSMFREQSAEAYEQMLSFLEKGDYTNLGMLAHKVKSSASIMGMNDLASMLKTLELQAREGKETGSYRSYIERFRTETSVALTELDDYIKTRRE
jgi:HPt (histidine-containing phosphotransfer) domain-containing protein